VTSGVVTDDNPINAIVDVLAVGVAIRGVQVLTFQTKVIAGSPNLTLENQTQVETAMPDY
jgi:hypothetical protein